MAVEELPAAGYAGARSARVGEWPGGDQHGHQEAHSQEAEQPAGPRRWGRGSRRACAGTRLGVRRDGPRGQQGGEGRQRQQEERPAPGGAAEAGGGEHGRFLPLRQHAALVAGPDEGEPGDGQPLSSSPVSRHRDGGVVVAPSRCRRRATPS
jgi:hypothetical protein